MEKLFYRQRVQSLQIIWAQVIAQITDDFREFVGVEAVVHLLLTDLNLTIFVKHFRILLLLKSLLNSVYLRLKIN